MQKIVDIALGFIELIRRLLAKNDKARTDALRDAARADPSGLLISKLGGTPKHSSNTRSEQHSKTDSQRE